MLYIRKEGNYMNIRIKKENGQTSKIVTKSGIVLAIDDKGRMALELSPSLTFEQAMSMLQTVQKHLMEVYSTDPNTKKYSREIAENIYDFYNAAASSLLDSFIPEKELRPDLTVEAILEKENEILDREWEKKNGTAKDNTPIS